MGIVMRRVSKRQLKELALYSPQHVARLKKAGSFPKRGQPDPDRVGWVEADVFDKLVSGVLRCSGLLVHLRSLKATMNQDSFRCSNPQIFPTGADIIRKM